jgi:hypothetical protein
VANANGTDDLDAGSDSDVASADGKVPFVAESTGDNEAGALVTDNPTIDAGFVQLVSIGDYVWYDRNRDGQQGAVADEPVVARRGGKPVCRRRDDPHRLDHDRRQRVLLVR